MPIVSVRLPQIGEGLQDARIVAFLKQPGDRVKRDEPIYQMETDKAVMDVESPYEGVLVGWSVQVDDIVLIGGEVGHMDTSESAAAAPATHSAPTAAPADSNVVSLRIPMIGEGLQDARVVAFLKNPGDNIKRDEPIYQMETDKAVMDVESPYEGVLVGWSAKVDDVLLIGAEVGTIKAVGAVEDSAPAHHATTSSPTPTAAAATPTTGERRRDIPPRTRAYAKDKGLSEETLATIPASGSKLMPDDIDKFLAGGAPPKATSSMSTDRYAEKPVPSKQRVLNSRMVRGSQLVVPGTISVAVRWDGIERARAAQKAKGGDFQPSSFTMFSYAVAQVVKDFPGLRTNLNGDDTYRTYHHIQLGIAVGLPGDELVLAVVDDADTLGWQEFAARMREKIDLARGGKDQANEAVTLSLTNMQSFGLRDAVPVVVPPSCGTLFLGEVYKGVDQQSEGFCNYANIALTFDHRIINGVGASQFVNAVRAAVEGIENLIA